MDIVFEWKEAALANLPTGPKSPEILPTSSISSLSSSSSSYDRVKSYASVLTKKLPKLSKSGKNTPVELVVLANVEKRNDVIFHNAATKHFKLRIQPNVPNYTGNLSGAHNRATFDDVYRYHDNLLPGKASRLEKALFEDRATVVYGSNMIDNVGCGLEETRKLCKEVFQCKELQQLPPRSDEYYACLEPIIRRAHFGNVQITERREVVNHAAAFLHIRRAFVKNNEVLTEELLQQTHEILCHGVDAGHLGGKPSTKYAGKYRTKHVKARDTNFVTPGFVPKAIRRFISKLNVELAECEAAGQLDPFYIAAKASPAFANIHPFLEGNGRISRLILNVITMRYAGCVVPIGKDNKERAEYVNITRHFSVDMFGPGELAAFILSRAKDRLQWMSERRNGIWWNMRRI